MSICEFLFETESRFRALITKRIAVYLLTPGGMNQMQTKTEMCFHVFRM